MRPAERILEHLHDLRGVRTLERAFLDERPVLEVAVELHLLQHLQGELVGLRSEVNRQGAKANDGARGLESPCGIKEKKTTRSSTA